MKLFAPIIIILIAIGSSCQSNHKEVKVVENKKLIKLLPLDKIEDKYIENIFVLLNTIHENVELMKPEPFPAFTYYAPRNRYRADSIIHWLQQRASSSETYIAITSADISTTKGAYIDYGVMGLGYMPGRACVASLYRLKDKRNFYKVVLHELAHTTGLPHCTNESCYLRDAKGGDPTNDETSFCKTCSNYLKNKGWKL